MNTVPETFSRGSLRGRVPGERPRGERDGAPLDVGLALSPPSLLGSLAPRTLARDAPSHDFRGIRAHRFCRSRVAHTRSITHAHRLLDILHSIYTYIHIYIYIYVCMYIYIYICTYVSV